MNDNMQETSNNPIGQDDEALTPLPSSESAEQRIGMFVDELI